LKFLCLICAEKVIERMSEAEAAQHFRDYAVVTRSLRESGHLLACNRLLPPETATTVRVRNGQIATTDGPFAETKEQVGGYYLIEARDQGEAVQIAARIPGARVGCVEVRRLADDDATLHALGIAAGA
jgi:hypothetical protein